MKGGTVKGARPLDVLERKARLDARAIARVQWRAELLILAGTGLFLLDPIMAWLSGRIPG